MVRLRLTWVHYIGETRKTVSRDVRVSVVPRQGETVDVQGFFFDIHSIWWEEDLQSAVIRLTIGAPVSDERLEECHRRLVAAGWLDWDQDRLPEL